jgi:hypothetical protein
MFWVVLAACSREPDEPDLVVATQNVGTTPFMNAIQQSDLREPCETWYDNNLCTLDAEQDFARALDAVVPTVLFLNEVWHDEWCEDPKRPADIQAAPFACAGDGEPLARYLPDSHHWACATDYPDNCIAFDPDRFVPDGTCDDRDCSAGIVDLQADCAVDGRAATLSGTLEGQPAILTVVHTNAGFFTADQECRAEELDAIRHALEPVDDDTVLLLGGDVNHDPEHTGIDADAFAALLEATGLQRLPDDGDTARLVTMDLDIVAARGVLEHGACTVEFVDEGSEVVMFDHALVRCR